MRGREGGRKGEWKGGRERGREGRKGEWEGGREKGREGRWDETRERSSPGQVPWKQLGGWDSPCSLLGVSSLAAAVCKLPTTKTHDMIHSWTTLRITMLSTRCLYMYKATTSSMVALHDHNYLKVTIIYRYIFFDNLYHFAIKFCYFHL